MFRTWWQKFFTFPRTRTARRAGARPPARLIGRTTRLSMTYLEDRITPALQLTYGGAGTALTLAEVSAAVDNVTVSEPVAGTLRIDLNGATFAAGSSTTGVTYQNAGSPTTSTFATINIAAANAVSTLTATLGAMDDVLSVAIVNAVGVLAASRSTGRRAPTRSTSMGP